MARKCVCRRFDVTPGKWIQGLVARWEQERRVYVVTITPEMEDAAYERWPRILSYSASRTIDD
ncbi:MAG: hypothetical protein B6D77_18580 [gamma proteobacterium symbiont of Ctena orbiculata]|nr:MAG: hypothetical protein B6D77_18580 [gamma proteobacterium symbiont of Ctena orbiculata]PVV22793.1 MAG: hypothetical protein B6D78_04400 [gamma proteobacterium symbiont of Ctena orbiculata]